LNVFVHLWLLLGIILYVIAMAIVFSNQLPMTKRLVEATKNPPPALPPGTPAPSGPPPHIAAMIRRVQMGGMVLTALLIAIIILMSLGANGFLD
jgi:small neutral amino acid transporter SnatA (MarC family)